MEKVQRLSGGGLAPLTSCCRLKIESGPSREQSSERKDLSQGLKLREPAPAILVRAGRSNRTSGKELALRAGSRGLLLRCSWAVGGLPELLPVARAAHCVPLAWTGAERLRPLPRRRTANSELVRTRGIRLFN
jgi:hypothetical protein